MKSFPGQRGIEWEGSGWPFSSAIDTVLVI